MQARDGRARRTMTVAARLEWWRAWKEREECATRDRAGRISTENESVEDGSFQVQ